MKKAILILLAVIASSVALATKYVQTDSLVYRTEQKVAFKNKLSVKFSDSLVVLAFSIVISLFSFLIAYSWYLKKLWVDYSLPLSELIGEDPQIIISESGDEGKPASHLVLNVVELKLSRLRLVNINYNYDKTKWQPADLVQTLVFVKTLGRIPRLIIGRKLTYFLEDRVYFIRGSEESVYIVLVAK